MNVDTGTSIAVIVPLFNLALLLAVGLHARERSRARRQRVPAPIEAPVPESESDQGASIPFIDDMFAGWERHVWGYGDDHDVTAYVWMDADQRWHVFITSPSWTFASAYVTVISEPHPLRPSVVSWWKQNHPDKVANALVCITAKSYAPLPMLLPVNCRAPSGDPHRFYPPNDGAVAAKK